MKKEDKIALKIIKKKFTLDKWESFPNEIKYNPILLKETSKLLSSATIENKKRIIENNPQILKYLPNIEQELYANKNNFSYLSNEIQNQMIKKNKKIVMFADDEVKKEVISTNPELLIFLTENDQINFVNENKFLISFATDETQIKMARKNLNLLSLCNEKIQCYFVKENPIYYKNCNITVQKELLTLKMLDFNKIDTDTLNTYLLVKGSNVDIDELVELKNKISNSSRDDKQEFDDYLNYLIANYTKSKFVN